MGQGFGNFKVADLYPGITAALAGKVVSDSTMQAAIKRAIYELSGSYDMQGLQVDGPFVQLVQYQSKYPPGYWMQPADVSNNLDLRKVNSFFVYYDPSISNPPPTGQGVTNSGVQLVYRSIGSIENNLNTNGQPAWWSRHASSIYIAQCPMFAYLSYMRYQHEHPFSNPIDDTDVIFCDDDWQDILEFASAMRIAIQTRLWDIADKMRIILYGDPKAVDAGGRRIDLGLIYSRTSQYERDVTTTTRSLRKRSY
jgi:hypothetical protein